MTREGHRERKKNEKPKSTLKFNKREIDALPPGRPKGTAYFDEELDGFYLFRYPSRTTFFVRYRAASGTRKAVKVGVYGPMTPDAARKEAKRLLSEANLGGDPSADRKKVRETPTWGKWVDTYLDRVRLTKKRPGEDERFLGAESDDRDPNDEYLALRRRWQGRAITSITAEDIQNFRVEIGKTRKPTSNRWLASVRACLSAAKRAGHIAFNPAMGIQGFRENPPRQRVLSPEEMTAFVGAILKEPDPYGRAGLLLLIETGCRLSELLHATWDDFDLDAEIPQWRIPSPKAGIPQVCALTEAVVDLLNQIPRSGPYVIKGRKKDSHRRDLKGPFLRAKAAAGLAEADFTVHDLRRTYGMQVARAAGLHVASKALRHSDIRVTERVYAPLGIGDLRDGIEKRASVLLFVKKTA